MNKLIILASLLLANCASGPVYSSINQPAQEQAKIVVYRPDAFLNMTSRFWVEVNGIEICKLHNNAFLTYDIAPGKITIASSNFGSIGTSRLTLTAKPNETVYVKMENNGQRAFSGALGIVGQLTDETISENAGPVYLGTVSKDKAHDEMHGLSEDCR